MAVKIIKAKLTEKVTIAKDTFLLRIPFQETMEFQAGQFVNILVAPNIRRSYSIATPPSIMNSVDLIGDSVVGGPGSKFFESIQVGDEIEMLGPLGQFVYKEAQKPVYFFATGTGVVPFISMITHALETLGTKRQIKLFVGFRVRETVFYNEYFEKLQANYPNFEYVVTVSQPDESWTGRKGRITNYYEYVVKQNPDIEAYICGSTKMIEDVALRLGNLGVNPNEIYYEKYY